MTGQVESFEDREVCVVGLGFVGLTLAVSLADAGFNVTGVEKNPEIMAALARSEALFEERNFNWRLRKTLAQGRFRARSVIPQGGAATVFVITVGTPIDESKRTKMAAIETAAEDVAAVLKPGDMVILRSTVRVGVSREVVKPILDRAGVAYDLAFCPERTIEGKAIEELRTLPQVIGGADAASVLRASRFFHMLTPSVVRVSSLEAAEMVKLVNNVHRDLMFAFANEVAGAAEASGLSAIEVVNAANRGYPRGGVRLPGPVGGPCLGKDPYIFAEGLEPCGFEPSLALAGRRLNEGLPHAIVARVAGALAARGVQPRKLAVLGLAFKGRPETSDLRGAPAKPLYEALREVFPEAEIVAWDPVVSPAAAREEIGVALAPGLEAASSGAAALIIQNNHPAFEHMDFAGLSARMAAGGLIYDLWGQNEGEGLVLDNGVDYAAFGSPIPQRRRTSPASRTKKKRLAEGKKASLSGAYPV